MITGQVIDTLFKKYKKRPDSPDDLDISLLFDDDLSDIHGLTISPDDNLIIGSIDPLSPFHRIPMRHIHAFVVFEKWVAIVLHSSIIFLNRKEPQVTLNIKPVKRTFMSKLRDKMRGE